MKGRAITESEKRKFINDVLDVWLSCPSLRFGQLIECAKPINLDDLFYIEDDKLLTELKKLKHNK